MEFGGSELFREVITIERLSGSEAILGEQRHWMAADDLLFGGRRTFPSACVIGNCAACSFVVEATS
jgi:hypothetical protein